MIPPPLTGSPAGQVLSILQRHGAVTIKDLETGLGVTATAVRQQIAGLLADGYIQQEIERTGRGRPKHVYSLTPKGRSLFPHHYDEFTNSLLREILISEGPTKVQELLGRMGSVWPPSTSASSPAFIQRTRDETDRTPQRQGHPGRGEVRARRHRFPRVQLPVLRAGPREPCHLDMEEDMIARAVQQPVELVSCTLDGHHGCQFKIKRRL